MKINHNMSAMLANKQLIRNEGGLTKSIERLSSGLKINHAADDAAGMAIATKMRLGNPFLGRNVGVKVGKDVVHVGALTLYTVNQ